MGTDKPEVGKTAAKTRKPFPLLLLGAAAVLAAIILFQTEFAELRPGEASRLWKRLREIDDSEQYALVAAVNGMYPCLHSGRTTCYLSAGEVWKYGVTSKGVLGRYTADFLYKNKVSYLIQFKGNYAECLKQEQIKLYHYPYLPENLARPPEARPPEARLPRPPYNPILR